MSNNELRREKLLEVIKNSDEAINATVLADMFSVTRQVIVADIALLRASGNPIRSEHRGYVYDKPRFGIKKRITCRHGREGTQEEFYAIVDNGGVVADVQVQHPIYGVISAELSISSRRDANSFVKRSMESDAVLLSDLTDGLHSHTVYVQTEEDYACICDALRDIGVLVDE